MRVIGLPGITVAVLLLGACANQQAVDTRMTEKGDPAFFKARDSMSDEVYVNEKAEASGWIDDIRRIYIAPANTSRTQIIQPHGVRASDIDAWEMTDIEEDVLQNKFLREMTRAMEADQAFSIVARRDEAQAVLYSRVIAIYPYQPRSVVEAGGKGGGAVTMSFSLVDPSDGTVMISALDSKSTDDIWAFDNMETNKTALDLIYEAWGHQIRRSLLFLQGRLDAMPPPMILKSQS